MYNEGRPESQFCQQFSPWVSVVIHLQPVLSHCQTDSVRSPPDCWLDSRVKCPSVESHAIFGECSIFLRKEHLAPSQTDKSSLENPDPLVRIQSGPAVPLLPTASGKVPVAGQAGRGRQPPHPPPLPPPATGLTTCRRARYPAPTLSKLTFTLVQYNSPVTLKDSQSLLLFTMV